MTKKESELSHRGRRQALEIVKLMRERDEAIMDSKKLGIILALVRDITTVTGPDFSAEVQISAIKAMLSEVLA